MPPPPDSTHSLLAGAGGASLASLARHASGNYLGAFFQVAIPLQQRLTTIGGRPNKKVAAMLVEPAAYINSQPWTNFARTAHQDAKRLDLSFTIPEHYTANLIAPRSNIIFSACDPESIAQGLSCAIATLIIRKLHEAAATPKGVRLIAACIQKLADLCTFFLLSYIIPNHQQAQTTY